MQREQTPLDAALALIERRGFETRRLPAGSDGRSLWVVHEPDPQGGYSPRAYFDQEGIFALTELTDAEEIAARLTAAVKPSTYITITKEKIMTKKTASKTATTTATSTNGTNGKKQTGPLLKPSEKKAAAAKSGKKDETVKVTASKSSGKVKAKDATATKAKATRAAKGEDRQCIQPKCKNMEQAMKAENPNYGFRKGMCVHCYRAERKAAAAANA